MIGRDDLFGFGLLRPFRRDRKTDFAAGGGEAAVRSAVGQILGTMASGEETQGELPWRTEFGSLLHLLRHARNDDVRQELARVHVADALARWEPRVRLTSVRVVRERDRGANVLGIRLRYDLVSGRSPPINLLIPGIEQVIFI